MDQTTAGAAEGVDDLDAAGLLAAVVQNREATWRAEARELALVVAWADLHGPERDDPVLVGGHRLRARKAGTDGTPWIGEHAAAELATVLQVSLVTARIRIRDAVDLRYRHPLLWQAVQAGRVRAWMARKVTMATGSAGLSLAQARWVDAQVVGPAQRLPWGRLEAKVAALVIAAAPAEAERRRQASALAQFVRAGQSCEQGLRFLIARAPAPVVARVLAMVDRIAQILLLEGDRRSTDERRAAALGWLADPHRAGALLERHALRGPAPEPPPPARTRAGERDGGDPEDPETISPGDLPVWDDDADDPPTPRCPACDGGGVLSAGSRSPRPRHALDLDKLRNPAVLYVHVSGRTFARGRHGVARVEGVGPVTVEQAREFLRHSRVRVVPVVDPAGGAAVDSYEVPATMAEALHLRNPASAFPWSGSVNRRMDKDHTTPYAVSSAVGTAQTRLANLGKLPRSEHRVKTLAPGWRVTQPEPGVFYWRTPHGYWMRVDRRGSHDLGLVLPKEHQQALARARPRGPCRSRSPAEEWFAALLAA